MGLGIWGVSFRAEGYLAPAKIADCRPFKRALHEGAKVQGYVELYPEVSKDSYLQEFGPPKNHTI